MLEDILDLLLQVVHVDQLFHVQQVQLPPGLTARLTSLFVPILELLGRLFAGIFLKFGS